MTAITDSELDELRSQYEAAFSVYQNLVAAVALAQGDDQSVPDELQPSKS